MSLKLNSSGGGSVTLQEPTTASNLTLNLPAVSGNVVTTGSTAVVSQAMLGAGVAGNGPSFSAYQSVSQPTISANTPTKIRFQAEEWDTGNCFDSTTNYRFIPTVAGYYHVVAGVGMASSQASITVSFYKNGILYRYGNNPGSLTLCNANCLVYLNGTTDYVEAYVTITVSQTLAADAAQTYFQGCLVRAA